MKSIYVRKPEKYEYPRILKYISGNLKRLQKTLSVRQLLTAQYDLFLGFLDKKSYQMVEAITLTDAVKTAITENKDAALPKLTIALTPPDKMPAKIELKLESKN